LGGAKTGHSPPGPSGRFCTSHRHCAGAHISGRPLRHRGRPEYGCSGCSRTYRAPLLRCGCATGMRGLSGLQRKLRGSPGVPVSPVYLRRSTASRQGSCGFPSDHLRPPARAAPLFPSPPGRRWQGSKHRCNDGSSGPTSMKSKRRSMSVTWTR